MLRSSAIVSPRVKTTPPTSPAPSLRSSARTYSSSACPRSRKCSRTPRSPKDRSTRSFSSVVRPVFRRFSSFCPTASTVRFSTRASTPMRPSLTVPLSRLPLSTVKAPKRPMSSCSSMSPLCPLVSGPVPTEKCPTSSTVTRPFPSR